MTTFFFFFNNCCLVLTQNNLDRFPFISPGLALHPGPDRWASWGSWPGLAAPEDEQHWCPGPLPSWLCIHNIDNFCFPGKLECTQSFDNALSNGRYKTGTLILDRTGLTHCGPTSRPSPSSCSSPVEPDTNPQQHGQPGLQPVENTQAYTNSCLKMFLTCNWPRRELHWGNWFFYFFFNNANPKRTCAKIGT